jgi:hypothetical protein
METVARLASWEVRASAGGVHQQQVAAVLQYAVPVGVLTMPRWGRGRPHLGQGMERSHMSGVGSWRRGSGWC